MRVLALAFVAIAVLVDADAASCQESDELGRWVASLGFSTGFIDQRASGTQQSNLRPPNDGLDPSRPLPGTPAGGSNDLLDPPVVFTGELMSPAVGSLLGSPRLFAHGDVGAIFGSEIILASEGSPGAFENPAKFPLVPSASIRGQGTQTTAEFQKLVVGAGVGVAFTADLWGRRFRLKPSFEYLRSEVRAKGLYLNVTGATTDPNKIFSALTDQKQKTLHSIGGGLEIEMDTLRAGPFMIALLLNGQVYGLLSDPKIHLSATDGTSAVLWDVRVDRATYRASAGMRFRFLPGS